MNFFKNINLFTILTKFLVIILPFYVILKVFFDVKIWFSFFWFFIKEFIVILLFIILIYYYIRDKKKPDFNILDYLIFSYIFYWIIITLINWLWLTALFYWGRYDFMFLAVFLIFRHSKKYLQISINNLIKIFLISAWLSLTIWVFFKFIFWEEALQLFWYSIYVSDWSFKWWIPIYHWVEASGLRRFQWILDSPNAMAFFLIIFSWLFAHYNRKNLIYHINLVLIILFILLLLTYSRSALLWAIAWISMIFLFNLKNVYIKYKKHLVWSLLILLILFTGLFHIFRDKVDNVFLREGSTKWHFDRMNVWIDRFLEYPFGQWLATAWPAYRKIYTNKVSKEEEFFYIPESWFIQQLIEWGFIYFSLFLSICLIILFQMYKKSEPIFWLIIWVWVMNIFLHTFEATYLSILMFIFIWLILKVNTKKIAKN
jgi:hypothetical protein